MTRRTNGGKWGLGNSSLLGYTGRWSHMSKNKMNSSHVKKKKILPLRFDWPKWINKDLSGCPKRRYRLYFSRKENDWFGCLHSPFLVCLVSAISKATRGRQWTLEVNMCTYPWGQECWSGERIALQTQRSWDQNPHPPKTSLLSLDHKHYLSQQS